MRAASAVCLALAATLPAGCGSSDTPGDPAEEARPQEQQRPPAQQQQRAGRRAARASATKRPRGPLVTVDRVVDGDTIDLANGNKVRLVQIDTPELTQGECYSGKAAGRLASLVPPGARVRLRPDPALDRRDRYGRLLRYVYYDHRNVNLELVRRGAATVWFYQGDRGRFAQRLIDASRRARRAKRGLWGACPRTRFDPEQGAATGGGSAGSGSGGGRDRDCSDFSSRSQAQRFFERHGGPRSDPHQLDADHNGRACESL